MYRINAYCEYLAMRTIMVRDGYSIPMLMELLVPCVYRLLVPYGCSVYEAGKGTTGYCPEEGFSVGMCTRT